MPTRVHQAIRECLNRCCVSSSPLADLAAFSEELRNNPDWTEREVRALHTRVLRLLRRIGAGTERDAA